MQIEREICKSETQYFAPVMFMKDDKYVLSCYMKGYLMTHARMLYSKGIQNMMDNYDRVFEYYIANTLHNQHIEEKTRKHPGSVRTK